MRARSLVLGLVAVGWLAVAAEPAGAGAACIGDRCWADDRITEPGESGSPERARSAGRSEWTCTVSPLYGPAHEEAPPGMAWYQRSCRHTSGNTDFSVFLKEIEDPGPSRAGRDLALAAEDRLAVPAPRIRMNPPVEQEQIVNLESWLWVERGIWRDYSARAEAGSSWAEATAVPSRVVWDMGNGDRVVCQGPGSPYDDRRPPESQSTDCSYTYPQSSAGQPGDRYTVTTTVVWGVSWQGSGGAGGDLGDFTRSSSVRVRVAELQAVKG